MRKNFYITYSSNWVSWVRIVEKFGNVLSKYVRVVWWCCGGWGTSFDWFEIFLQMDYNWALCFWYVTLRSQLSKMACARIFCFVFFSEENLGMSPRFFKWWKFSIMYFQWSFSEMTVGNFFLVYSCIKNLGRKFADFSKCWKNVPFLQKGVSCFTLRSLFQVLLLRFVFVFTYICILCLCYFVCVFVLTMMCAKSDFVRNIISYSNDLIASTHDKPIKTGSSTPTTSPHNTDILQ